MGEQTVFVTLVLRLVAQDRRERVHRTMLKIYDLSSPSEGIRNVLCYFGKV